MKILHTSDWHLGMTDGEKSLYVNLRRRAARLLLLSRELVRIVFRNCVESEKSTRLVKSLRNR